MKVGRYIAAGVSFVAVLAVAKMVGRYQRHIQAARERIMAGSQIIETGRGPVEYGDTGNGPSVLVIHGTGGGYDQGMLLGSLLLGDGYRVIAPSRFGYLNASIPADSSLEAQADTFASLLDALGINKVAVVGISAGGPPAFHFILRHPARVSALILASAISYAEKPTPEQIQQETMLHRVIASDIVYWLAINTARTTVIDLLGVPPKVQARASPQEQDLMDQFLETMLPMRMRVDGIAVDRRRTFPRDFPLHKIAVPTLVMHARDDKLVAFEHGQHSAQNIPNALFMPLEDGGHFLAGHYEEIREASRAFLGKHVGQAT